MNEGGSGDQRGEQCVWLQTRLQSRPALYILTEVLAYVHVRGPAHLGGVRGAGRNIQFKIETEHDQRRILERMSTK